MCHVGGALVSYAVIFNALFWESAGVCLTDHDGQLPNKNVIPCDHLQLSGMIRYHAL